jgi:hypothetical protein
MRSMGVDLASAGLSAVALAVAGEPDKTSIWKPYSLKDSDATKLVGFERWLSGKIFAYQPDIVVVEETTAGGTQHIKPALQIAKREGVALLVAKKRKGVIVISAGIRSSRSIVLSTPEQKAGGLKKEVAFEVFKKRYPNFKLLPKTAGGMDQMDAMVHALAGPVLRERR